MSLIFVMLFGIIKLISKINDALKGGSKMAKKRMFSLDVVDTDAFLDLPASTQALYFHLGMHGDDDGFVGNPRKLTRNVGCRARDLTTLIEKGYVIAFPSGVVAGRDWRLNNELKNDRYHGTIYAAEKELLSIDASRRYVLEPSRHSDGSALEPEHNLT